MAELELQLLGPMRVWRRPGEEIAVSSRSGWALIVYLAVNRSEPKTREQLAALLWPDRGAEQALHSLRQTLFAFRQTLAPHGADLLRIEGKQVWFDPAVDVDFWNFAKLAREATPPAMHAAVGLYKGELAAGFQFRSDPFERWLAAERTRLRDAACTMMSRLVAQFSQLGDLDEAIRINRKLVEADPAAEEAHRSLMRLLAAAGKHQAALDHYRDCANALRRLLDTTPGPDTTKLFAEIRAQVAEQAVRPTPALSIEDGGAGGAASPTEIGSTLEPVAERSGCAGLALPAAAQSPRSKVRVPRLAAVGAAGFALLVGVVDWYALGPDRSKSGMTNTSVIPHTGRPDSTPPTRAASSRVAPLSLVVLPFVNLSGDKQQDWFADGITEELTIDLSRVPNAFVIARSSAFTYKGKFVDVKQIGRELNVRYVIEGSVRRDAEQVRLIVQIADSRSAAQVWSERYIFDRAELTKTLDLVVASVARAIQLTLEDAEGRRLERQRSTNPDAAELMMRARALLNTAPRERLKAMKAAVPFLERAIEIDSNSVSAWALLAIARASQVLGKGHDRREATDQEIIASASHAAQRALALDPHSIIALIAMGQVKRASWQPDEAIDLYERARALNPYYSPILGELARAYALVGRAADAIPLYDLALRLSPKDPALRAIISNRCSANLMIGRYSEAIVDCEKAMKLGRPPDNLLARSAFAYLWAGDRKRALEIAERYRQREPNMTVRSCRKLNHPSNHPTYRAFVDRSCNGLRDLGFPE